MKNEKQEQAKEMYFDTNMSKSEIAAKLGINRRTVMLWCQQGNWDKLRESGRHLPSLVAEKCYYLIDRFMSRLLINDIMVGITYHDADVINKLASAIKKLKNRSTVNESMEMFNFFMESLKKTDPQLAESLMPHVEGYMEARKDVTVNDFLLEEFEPNGDLPNTGKEQMERYQDQQDTEAFKKEFRNANNDFDLAVENWQKAETADPTGHISEAA